MIYYKTDEEIELIRESSLIVSQTLAEIGKNMKPGVTTLQLDKLAEEFIRDNGGVPAFKDYRGFPNSICASPNEVVVHGIPTDEPLKDGDILSVDCGVLKNKFYGDSAYTFAIGNIKPEIVELMQVTKKALDLGVEKAVAGNRVGDISYAIQQYAEVEKGFGIVRELVGHGVGKHLHESPEIPNYGRKNSGLKLKDGLVIAIEPMINLGTKRVATKADGWTIVTKDHKPSAHFEHILAIRKGKADILSDFGIIEEAVKNNADIQEIEFKI